MLKAIRDYFERSLRAPAAEDERGERHRLQVATAALLIEMMRMDSQIKEVERAAVVAAMREKFGLSRAETEALLRLAEEEARQATDYYQFTSLINKGFSVEQKARIVEYLWAVAFADGHLDKYEEHLVRKLADLLYVPHTAFIVAKHRARGPAR